MDIWQQVLLSLIGALIGFLFSQSFNIVRFFRKPKFKLTGVGDGVISSYTGNPPDVPSEVVLGFYLENCGWNPAKNTRIFVSNLEVADNGESAKEDMPFEFTELKRPVDIIPSGEVVIVTLGKIFSDTQHLQMPFQSEVSEELADTVRAHTRSKKVFYAKFHIFCDDINSSTILNIKFDPTLNDWASSILEGHMPTVELLDEG